MNDPIVFTPWNEDKTERLAFTEREITVLSGNRHKRGRGVHAIILIGDTQYKVIGLSCGLPRCMCDAYLKKISAAA